MMLTGDWLLGRRVRFFSVGRKPYTYRTHYGVVKSLCEPCGWQAGMAVVVEHWKRGTRHWVVDLLNLNPLVEQ